MGLLHAAKKETKLVIRLPRVSRWEARSPHRRAGAGFAWHLNWSRPRTQDDQATMAKPEIFPDWGIGYTRYRGLFFDVLRRLADQGFVAQLGDGHDLIHEFFLSEWNGLAAKFDPARGSVATYVFRAFLRFARKRIARLHRRQQRELSVLPALASTSPIPSPLDVVV